MFKVQVSGVLVQVSQEVLNHFNITQLHQIISHNGIIFEHKDCYNKEGLIKAILKYDNVI